MKNSTFDKKRSMNFSNDKIGEVVVITSHVEKLDASNAAELKSVFLFANKNGDNRLIFNMKQTKYCDSSGLSAILTANRLCKDSSGSFALSGLQPSVAKMISIAQLDKVLSISDTLEGALTLV